LGRISCFRPNSTSPASPTHHLCAYGITAYARWALPVISLPLPFSHTEPLACRAHMLVSPRLRAHVYHCHVGPSCRVGLPHHARGNSTTRNFVMDSRVHRACPTTWVEPYSTPALGTLPYKYSSPVALVHGIRRGVEERNSGRACCCVVVPSSAWARMVGALKLGNMSLDVFVLSFAWGSFSRR
jgi:hypothetical protein